MPGTQDSTTWVICLLLENSDQNYHLDMGQVDTDSSSSDDVTVGAAHRRRRITLRRGQPAPLDGHDSMARAGDAHPYSVVRCLLPPGRLPAGVLSRFSAITHCDANALSLSGLVDRQNQLPIDRCLVLTRPVSIGIRSCPRLLATSSVRPWSSTHSIQREANPSTIEPASQPVPANRVRSGRPLRPICHHPPVLECRTRLLDEVRRRDTPIPVA